jgi:hypothetical protein
MQSRHDPAVAIAIFTRLGTMFLDFKGEPSLCAMYYVVKLAMRVAKGAVVGAFYGGQPAGRGPPWQAACCIACCIQCRDGPHHADLQARSQRQPVLPLPPLALQA